VSASAAAAAAGLGMGTGGMPMSTVTSANPPIQQAEYALSMVNGLGYYSHSAHQYQHQYGVNAAHATIPRPLRKEVTLIDEGATDNISANAIDAISQQLIGQVYSKATYTITTCIIIHRGYFSCL
jgi:hypothetical protein